MSYTPVNKIVHTTSVDFIGWMIPKPIHLVQGDHGLPIIAVKIPTLAISDIEMKLRYKDPKGNKYIIDALGTNDVGNIIYFEVISDMTRNYGDAKAVVEIDSQTAIAQSRPILFVIDPNPIQEGGDY